MVVLAGCGSAPLPPAAAPSPPPVTIDGRTARLDTRARTLSLGDERVAAGLGPTSLAAGDERLYVTDQVQDALLVFRVSPKLVLQRRVRVAGGPRRVVRRGDRLEIELAQDDEVVELTADGAAKFLRRRTK